ARGDVEPHVARGGRDLRGVACPKGRRGPSRKATEGRQRRPSMHATTNLPWRHQSFSWCSWMPAEPCGERTLRTRRGREVVPVIPEGSVHTSPERTSVTTSATRPGLPGSCDGTPLHRSGARTLYPPTFGVNR